jgi:hypothetical protein
MKNMNVFVFSLLFFAGCSKNQDSTSNSIDTQSLSQKVSSALMSDLETSASNTANKIGYPYFMKDLQTFDSTFTLTTAEIVQIKSAIETEITSQNLSSSSELNSVLPAVLIGAETALNSFADKTATEKLAIIEALSGAAVTAVSTFDSYAIDSADADNASKEAEMLQQISKAIVGHAAAAGFTASDIASLSETVTSSIVKNIDKAGIVDGKLAESINFAASGAVMGINTLSAQNLTGFAVTDAETAMQSITAGAIGAFGNITAITSGTQVPDLVKNFTAHMTGTIDLLTSVGSLDLTAAQDFVKNISSGATKGIGSINRTDMTIDDLPNLAEQVSQGAIQGLSGISMAAFTADQLPNFVKKVAEGSVSALSLISYANYDTANYASMIENINTGATKGLASITMTGYTSAMLPDLVENIAAGSTGVLDTLLAGENPSLLNTMVSSVSKGSTAGLEDLNQTGAITVDSLASLAQSITMGATMALQDISMTGFSSTIMEGMLSSITQGAAAGFADYTMVNFDSTKMTAVMSSISAGATEGISNFTTLTNLSSGTFNPTTALTYVATGLTIAASDMSDTYTISSGSLTTAITSGMTSTSGTLTMPSDLNTTISSGLTAGPMVYGAFFQDTDADLNQIAGAITIMRAMNETDVTAYRIYYGTDPLTKYGDAITTIAVSSLGAIATNPNFIYDVAANTATPQNVYYFLVYTVTSSESAKGFPVPIYDYVAYSNNDGTTSTTTGSYATPPPPTYSPSPTPTATATPTPTPTPTATATPVANTIALISPSIGTVLTGSELLDTECRMGGGLTIRISNNTSVTPTQFVCPSVSTGTGPYALAGHIKISVSTIPGFTEIPTGCPLNCEHPNIEIVHFSMPGLSTSIQTFVMDK